VNSFALKINLKKWSRTAGPLAFLLWAGLSASADTLAPAGDPAGSASRVYQDGGTWVQEITGSLPAPREIKVVTEAGSVKVHGAAQSNLTYILRKRVRAASEEEARKLFSSFYIKAWSSGDLAEFRGQFDSRYGRRQAAVDFDIATPRATAAVNAETGGGSIGVNNIAGTVAAETGGGSIQLDEIGGPATASSGGGTIELGNMGGDVSVETGGGAIRIKSAGGSVAASSGGGSIEVISARRAVSAETGGGSIRVQKCGAEVKMQSGGGSLEVGEAGGAVTAETGGGSIRVWSAQGKVSAGSGGGSIHLTGLTRGVSVETGAGGIIVEFASGATLTESALETNSGDVTVYLPANVGVTVRGAIESGSRNSLRSDFSELRVVSEGSDEYGPHEVLVEGKLNGGGPVLKIRTSTGKIELLRASK
jgi:hypothetical protein